MATSARINSLWHDNCYRCAKLLNLYQMDPSGFLLNRYHSTFCFVTMELQEAFINFFNKNSINTMELEEDDWIAGVQIALNNKKINISYQKEDKLKKDLSDIHKLRVRLRNYYRRCFIEDEDEGEDEDEKQKQKQQQDQKKILLTEEAERLIKVMGDIAVDLGILGHIEIIQGVLYDVEKGEQKKKADGSFYFVDTKKNLSQAQMKMSRFAEFLAHPPPNK